MTKTSKTPLKLAKNASKLHKNIGKILDSCDLFKNYEIRQEYRVKAVNEDFHSNREKFDWVILGMNVVIEGHGAQHYKATRFGGPKDEEKKLRDFKKLQERDEAKKQAALEADWAYVIVTYKEVDITEEELLTRIRSAIKQSMINKTEEKLSMLQKICKEKKKDTGPRKAKIQSQGFQKQKGKYKWPTRKLNS